MELPTVTVRRVLEELVAYGLAKRQPQGQGLPDLWCWIDWTEHLAKDPPDSGGAQCRGAFQTLEGDLLLKTSSYGKWKN